MWFSQRKDWSASVVLRTTVNKSETTHLSEGCPSQPPESKRTADIITVTLSLQPGTYLRSMTLTQLTRWLECQRDPGRSAPTDFVYNLAWVRRARSRWGVTRLCLSLLKCHVSGAQLGQQRMLVDELERCCPLTHGKEKEEERKKKKCLWLRNNYAVWPICPLKSTIGECVQSTLSLSGDPLTVTYLQRSLCSLWLFARYAVYTGVKIGVKVLYLQICVLEASTCAIGSSSS